LFHSNVKVWYSKLLERISSILQAHILFRNNSIYFGVFVGRGVCVGLGVFVGWDVFVGFRVSVGVGVNV
jgi:UDP-3-O-[3-hydroxymyristoyl] glucosamine N-acyltransferase